MGISEGSMNPRSVTSLTSGASPDWERPNCKASFTRVAGGPICASPNRSGKVLRSRAGCRVRTKWRRFRSGLPRLSKVFRPITTTLPVVIFLNHLKSSGRCQGMVFPCPMTRFSLMAAMALKCFTSYLFSVSAREFSIWPPTRRVASQWPEAWRLPRSRSYGDWGLDRRVRVVADQLEILELKLVDVLHRGIQLQSRERARFTRELQPGLFEVVGIKMQVTESVHENARLQATDLGHHQGEQ